MRTRYKLGTEYVTGMIHTLETVKGTMGLNLPKYEQVIFDESPLEEVVCQLRFHPILKISSGSPVQLQDVLRKRFPVFAEEQGVAFLVTGKQPFISAPNEIAWQFKSTDDAWIASLTTNFVALKTTKYKDIEGFIARLFEILPAFEEIYEPPFYTRVGLRYVNRLILPRENGKRVTWGKYLNRHLASIYNDPVLEGSVAEASHQVVLDSEHGKVGWRYSCDFGETDGKPAERFTLDFDHFVGGEIERSAVRERLLSFNDVIFRLFCWCLTEDGYSLLKPRPKSGRSGT